MKKLAIIVAALSAVTIHAASIDWTVTGRGNLTDYSGSAYSSTVYFILADSVASLTGNTSQSEFETALSSLILNGEESATSTGGKPNVENKTVTNGLITGTGLQTFGLLVYSQDSDGNGYYKIATSSATGYATGASADAHTFVETSWTDLRGADWVSAWTKQDDPTPPGPQPDVPEPATGALALAGVALLFKRRRA